MPPPRLELPRDYATTLAEIKRRVRDERLRVVLTANSAMVLLYWDIGRMILKRQESAGWGAKVIDRLAADLREAFPDARGFSPRNLKYMRAFAAAWSSRAFVQETLARIPWYHNIALLEKLDRREDRLWYALRARAEGWSHEILVHRISCRAHAIYGKAVTNFSEALPPADSDMAGQVFKDPYLFDFLGTADLRREREVEQALVDHVRAAHGARGKAPRNAGRCAPAPRECPRAFAGRTGRPIVPATAGPCYPLAPRRLMRRGEPSVLGAAAHGHAG